MRNISWVVYNAKTLKIVKGYKQHKAALVFAGKNVDYALASIEWYMDTIDPKLNELVEVQSLMGGSVKIPRRDLGGPCDPSTERYWAM